MDSPKEMIFGALSGKDLLVALLSAWRIEGGSEPDVALALKTESVCCRGLRPMFGTIGSGSFGSVTGRKGFLKYFRDYRIAYKQTSVKRNENPYTLNGTTLFGATLFELNSSNFINC